MCLIFHNVLKKGYVHDFGGPLQNVSMSTRLLFVNFFKNIFSSMIFK